MNAMALIFILGCVSLLMLAIVLPRNRPVKKKEPVISKADELMYEARISLREFPEEQKWLETQALRVGFTFPAYPRAQEKTHEKSTTVRDFSGRIIAEHRCTCTSCSSSDVPDSIRYSGLPARVAAAIQHPGPVGTD